MPAVSTNRHSLPPSSTISSTGSRVVPASSLTTTRSSPAALFSSEDLPTFGRPRIATRRGSADLVLGDRRDVGQHLHDLVEQVGDAAAVDRRDRVRLAETQVPQRGGLGLVAGVVDLVGDEEDGLAALAEQLHDVLVGRGRADHRVDDEQHDVAEVDRDLGLRGDGRVDAAGVGLPAAGVDEREAAVHPLGLVRHAVARDARGVLDDGLAAAEDAVHERGLADVRAPDDRDDRQRRRSTRCRPRRARRPPAARHPRRRARSPTRLARSVSARCFGELLVEVGEGLGDLVVAAFVFVVSAHRALLSVWERPRGRRRARHPRSVRNRGSDESTTVTPGAAVRKSTTVESEASRRCSASATARGIVAGQLGAAARGAHVGRRGEQDPHGGVGRDDGGDVAPFDDDAGAIGCGDERAEQGVDRLRAPRARARRRSRHPSPAARGSRPSRRSARPAPSSRRGRARSRSRSRPATSRTDAESDVSAPCASACQASAR